MPGQSDFLKRSSIIKFGAAAILAVGLSACGTTAERPQVTAQDYRTCSDFGADPGSRAYSECMLAQQRRRDTAELDELERSRHINGSARDAYAAAELARRARCDRDPNRRECGQ